jgi:hypothetical protein
MADSFWKSLGSKVVEAGAAYVQQVRVVNELRQLSPDEARARFAKYVQGLSGTARVGFAVTLATLAKNERSVEAKRFVESLRAALVNRPAAVPAAPDAPAPLPAAPRGASFDDDLARASDWYELEGAQREQAIDAHLAALDVGGLESLRAHLERMQLNCADNIKDHHEHEARIAAGRFFEDQANYRMAVLRTGQHDPDWLRGLRELEVWARWFNGMHEAVGLAIERRLAPPAPPPPPPARSDRLHAVEAMKQLWSSNSRAARYAKIVRWLCSARSKRSRPSRPRQSGVRSATSRSCTASSRCMPTSRPCSPTPARRRERRGPVRARRRSMPTPARCDRPLGAS